MKKTKSGSPAELRREAERRLAAGTSARLPGRTPRADQQRLVHELEVHQIELEIQNEALVAAGLETEEALERYLSLFDFAPIGYTMLDADGTIREANHSAARIIQVDRARVVGRPFEAFVALRDRPTFRMLLGRALASGLNEVCELELGGVRGVRWQGHLVAIALAGVERRVLLAFEDVTERRAKEEKLASTESALRDVDRRKDEFLAVLSHELRNPLAAIRNSSAVLSRVPSDDPRAARAKVVIDRQVMLLTRLVDDLLDVTRIARGKIELHRDRFELSDLVLRTMDDHRSSFEVNGIHLETRLEQGAFWVYADAARVVQIVSNLLGNAEKFTPRDGTVVVSLERDDDQKVALRVRDTGAGIEPETLPHVLESFVQAPQTIDRARGGLGLGLAMVKGLVELHGGSVSVASEGRDRGTEVTVLLPTEPASLPVPVPDLEVTPRRRRRVLVIDDNADNAETMQEVLRLDGHDVRIAYDGPTGIDLARTFHPEIVMCDIGLPGMDGYAVARAFRADEALKDVSLVAVTGYTRPEDLRRAADAGFDKHLAKPVSTEALGRVVSEAPEAPRAETGDEVGAPAHLH
jgi:two-component system CheB/CheR fusion protein